MGEGFAVWVVGKSPRGNGWQLGVTSKTDAKWWLEVEGTPETRGGLV